jgi:hypothetical protein
MNTIFISRVVIDKEDRIRLHFKYDNEVLQDIKTLPGILWDPDHKYWHIPDMEHPVTYLRKSLNAKYKVHYQDIPKSNHDTESLIFYQVVPSENRIYVKFEYNVELIDLIKTFDSPYWHSVKKLWSINGGKENLRIFINTILTKEYKPVAVDIYLSDRSKHKLNTYKASICKY